MNTYGRVAAGKKMRRKDCNATEQAYFWSAQSMTAEMCKRGNHQAARRGRYLVQAPSGAAAGRIPLRGAL